MIGQLKTKVSRHLSNASGWRTNRRIIVFESDDWGSIRMPSKEVFNILLSKGLRVDLCPYNKYDSIAGHDDLTILYETLNQFKDSKGKSPVITINVNTANPNFSLIAQSEYSQYFYETFKETIERYNPNTNIFNLWEQGIESGFLFPQYHHREHINTELWLELLRNNSWPIKLAFEHEVFGLSMITSSEIKVPYLASLLFRNDVEFIGVEKALIEGALIFNNIFKFKSKSIIAPLYCWDSRLEQSFLDAGIKYIQGSNTHMTYNFNSNNFKRQFHTLGKSNLFGQIYLHRNCSFEPAILKNKFSIKTLLDEIEIAFFWRKPVVISVHRLNFIGSIFEENRKENIALLNQFLHELLKKWPNIEFFNTVQLGELIDSQ